MAQGASLFRLLNIVICKSGGHFCLTDTIGVIEQAHLTDRFLYLLLPAVVMVLGGVLLFVHIKSWNSGILGVFIV